MVFKIVTATITFVPVEMLLYKRGSCYSDLFSSKIKHESSGIYSDFFGFYRY